MVNKINLLHKPLLRYQYFNDSIKNKKWHFFDFEITTCKTTRKRQKEGQFTTPVPVEPKILTAAEVIEELIELSKEIQKMDKEPQEMGLSDFEYAFYTAIANNDSARELMEKDKLRELAVVLFEKVKANASIDWTIKESVKAKLKVIVKRTLRQYGYPPDMQKLATETVLKQAELIANEITRGE